MIPTTENYDFPSLRSPQVAELLGVSEATVFRWVKRGEGPPSYKLGKARLWRRSDLVAWCEAECRQAQAGE